MELKLYLYRKQGQQRAITLEHMLRNNVRVTEVAEVYGKEVKTERLLQSEEDIAQCLPGGTWHTLTLVEEFLGEHDERLQVRLQKPSRDGFESDTSDIAYFGALAEIAVNHWDLPYPKNADGFRQMSSRLARFLGGLIKDHCYPPLLSDEDFTDPSTLKWGNSNVEGV